MAKASLRIHALAMLYSSLAASACTAASQNEEATQSEPVVPAVDPVVQKVLDDAAMRSGTDRADLRLLGVEAVTWPDGSLGCPLPGVVYTQAPVPGYRIRIAADGKVLDYHVATSGHYILCPGSRSIDPLPEGSGEIQ